MFTIRVGNFELSTMETLSIHNDLEWRSSVFVRRAGEDQLLEILVDVGEGDTWIQARDAAIVLGREYGENLDPNDSVAERQRKRGW